MTSKKGYYFQFFRKLSETFLSEVLSRFHCLKHLDFNVSNHQLCTRISKRQDHVM